MTERCPECERLMRASLLAAERLKDAQMDLARYRPLLDDAGFARLWNICVRALETSAALREEMAEHLATHRRSDQSES